MVCGIEFLRLVDVDVMTAYVRIVSVGCLSARRSRSVTFSGIWWEPE